MVLVCSVMDIDFAGGAGGGAGNGGNGVDGDGALKEKEEKGYPRKR